MSVVSEKQRIIIAGLIIGAIASLLVLAGNPQNMGFCIACFIRDSVGGLGLHRAAPVQYIRPEIIGLVLGAFLLSWFRGERAAKGGSAPATQVILLGLVVAAPAFIFFTEKGPGAIHAPLWISLAAGLVVGGLAQYSRLCMVGGIRDIILFKETKLILGFIAILVAAFLVNISVGNFHPGFVKQPIAHTDGLWNFLGMALAGLCCTLMGGCPLRQLILSGEGNSDSAITVVGLAAGAAFAHNFGLAATGTGVPVAGQIAVGVGFVIALVIAVKNMRK